MQFLWQAAEHSQYITITFNRELVDVADKCYGVKHADKVGGGEVDGEALMELTFSCLPPLQVSSIGAVTHTEALQFLEAARDQ